MISICIAIGIPLIREGLIHTLSHDRGILISAIAMQSDAVVHSCRPGTPEVLVLDTALPGDATAALLRRIRQNGSEAAVVLCGTWSPETAGAARRLECSAILSWFDTPDAFVRAVHYAASGDEYISDDVRAMLLEHDTVPETAGSRLDRLLTPTERQIFRALSENRTSKDIARRMFISYRTVQKHRNNIARKLNLEGSNALMSFAIRFYQGKK